LRLQALDVDHLKQQSALPNTQSLYGEIVVEKAESFMLTEIELSQKKAFSVGVPIQWAIIFLFLDEVLLLRCRRGEVNTHRTLFSHFRTKPGRVYAQVVLATNLVLFVLSHWNFADAVLPF
jgi:hypothetical protein